MTMPNVLYNGPGNWPDADKLMANYNYLENVATGYTSFRNRIINGDMRIDQRNEGNLVTQTTGNLYPVDRWRIYGSVASKFTAQRNYSITPPVGYSNHLGINSLSSYSVGAGEAFTITQAIEGFSLTDLYWGNSLARPVTLSFLFRSNMSGGTAFGMSLQNSAGTRSYPFSFKSSTANSWEYKSITIPGDQTGTWLTDNGAGIVLRIGLGVGTSLSSTEGAWLAGDYRSVIGAASIVGTNAATFFISGVQLEVGSLSTPFEILPMSTELELCQRYFEKSYDQGASVGTATTTGSIAFRSNGTSHLHPISLKVIKRAQPTVTLYNTSTGGTGSWRDTDNNANRTAAADYIGYSNFRVALVSTVDTASMAGHYTAEAEL
jgi:hypothetical protein